jgi:hypothetical protein
LEITMKLRTFYPASIGVCLTLLALSAGGQTTTGNASHDAVTPGKAATAGATTSAASKSAMAPASNTQHHATAHHKTHAKHKQMATASPTSNQDTAYHAALKHCVAGPAGQRESCLDDTIARFGRA